MQDFLVDLINDSQTFNKTHIIVEIQIHLTKEFCVFIGHAYWVVVRFGVCND